LVKKSFGTEQFAEAMRPLYEEFGSGGRVRFDRGNKGRASDD